MAEKPKANIGCGIVVLVIIALIGGGYDAIDKFGWIPHSKKVQVKFPEHGWEVGEYVNCAAISADTVRTELDCGEGFLSSGTVRELDVKFWGVVGKDPVIFKCQRDQDAITCHLADK
jgi:hypothetical protein